MKRPGTYNFILSVFHGAKFQHSASGNLALVDKNGIGIETVMWNDWVEIGVIIRELCMKYKLKISLGDGKGNVFGYTCTGRKKVRMVK